MRVVPTQQRKERKKMEIRKETKLFGFYNN